jgi:5-oxopent-3-ene-1,2,5-tricarboxylate decarboxylase/2-hydroxyhepta-2,4-diene-1,7-dioate isomerase
MASLFDLTFDVAPYRLSGTVYGVLLNHRDALAALGEAASRPPHKAPPKAPVLYLKPRNTLVAPGAPIRIDDPAGELEVGAALGIVVGRTACRVAEQEAMDCVAGYVIVADCSLPHDSYYRPAIRFKARDGSCAIGPKVTGRADIADPDALGVRILIDGRPVHTTGTGGTFRGVARLLSDVSDFMTLAPGDVLLAGVAAGSPRVGAGVSLAIEIDGLGRLEARVVAAAEAEAGR